VFVGGTKRIITTTTTTTNKTGYTDTVIGTQKGKLYVKMGMDGCMLRFF